MAEVEASSSASDSNPSLSRSVSFSRLNAQAPEFVPSPRSNIQAMPPPPPPPQALIHLYHVPNRAIISQKHHHHQHPMKHHHFHPQQQLRQTQPPKSSDHSKTSSSSTPKLSDDSSLKLLNQVEYYFSDLNLATTDHLMRFISKDPEGFVPVSIVASFKKIKALVNGHAHLATILRNSSKLVVSEDGKKVKRLHPITESDMEELQSRIVVAENLPEDHCHQNLMKVFSAVGSVKTIRTCQPQNPNGGTSAASRSAKSDNMHYTNKLHAFVEYESVEVAEKAVTELNEEGTWRSGLRVRLMVKRSSKTGQGRGKKGQDGEEEEEAEQIEDAPQDGQSVEEAANEQRKGRNRGRGKGRARHIVYQRSAATPPPAGVPAGPRMPDGTRGFPMGRGKPVALDS